MDVLNANGHWYNLILRCIDPGVFWILWKWQGRAVLTVNKYVMSLWITLLSCLVILTYLRVHLGCHGNTSSFVCATISTLLVKLLSCKCQILMSLLTVLLVEWSVRVTANHWVKGSMPGISTISKVDEVWNGIHPASRGQLDNYFIDK